MICGSARGTELRRAAEQSGIVQVSMLVSTRVDGPVLQWYASARLPMCVPSRAAGPLRSPCLVGNPDWFLITTSLCAQTTHKCYFVVENCPPDKEYRYEI